jgi:hypothetical protein
MPQEPTREERRAAQAASTASTSAPPKPAEPAVTGEQLKGLLAAWKKSANAPDATTEAERADLVSAFCYWVDQRLGYVDQPSGRPWQKVSAWERQEWMATCMEAVK